MWKFIVKRILWVIPVLLGASLLVFTLLYFSPGDPATTFLGMNATEEETLEFNVKHGLDKPFFTQYTNYIKDIVTEFDFGNSYKNNVSVSQRIKETVPLTFKLALCSVLVMILVGIPLGIISALKQYSILDNIVLGMFGVSMPNFWLGLQLILLFALKLRWLPASGFNTPVQYILPSLTLGIAAAASLMRTTRSAILEVMRQDYIKTARAKGQSEGIIIFRHMLKNALIPIITVVMAQFSALMGNAIVVESIFSIPGLSKMMIEAVTTRDYIVVQGAVLVIAFTCCVVNLLMDLSYAMIDPRIKAQYVNQGKKARYKRKEVVKQNE